MTIGDRIREEREKCGLTMEALGEKCGTTKQTIYKYENNIITNIPIDKIQIIADTLFVSPAYLAGWEDRSKSASLSMMNPTMELLDKSVAQLNDEGQEKLVEYADDLVSSGKYSPQEARTVAG